MPLTPKQRAKRVVDIAHMHQHEPYMDLLAEYLKWEHCKLQGIRPAHDTPTLREMVEVHYEAYRWLLLEHLDRDPDVLQQHADQYRPTRLVPLPYANP